MMYCTECDQWVHELHHVVYYSSYTTGHNYTWDGDECDGQEGELIFSCPPPVNFPDDWDDVELMYEGMIGERDENYYTW